MAGALEMKMGIASLSPVSQFCPVMRSRSFNELREFSEESNFWGYWACANGGIT